MIADLLETGSIPVLERLVQFTGARHRLITNNIANLSTPYYRPQDLDPDSFQVALGDAIAHRRRAGGELALSNTRQLHFRSDGIDARPQSMDSNILFHDQNNRNLERIMQHLAENTLAHNAAIEFLKSEFDLLKTAIRERL